VVGIVLVVVRMKLGLGHFQIRKEIGIVCIIFTGSLIGYPWIKDCGCDQ
jgi:hypothetical protein